MPLKNFKFKLALCGTLLLFLIWSQGCRTSEQPRPVGGGEAAEVNDERPVILTFGDSLTEGYGLEKSQAYPALLQKRLDAAGLKYRVVNAGISGETTAGGASRIRTALAIGKVKYMVLELGANDMLRGGDLKLTRANLDQIIKAAREKKVTVILAGMLAPTNLGAEYGAEFSRIFKELAKDYQLALIPFFLDGVAGNAELNQSDGMHPNVQGAKLVEENVWKTLGPMLSGK